MKIHILGRNALNCALYLKFNGKNLVFSTGKKVPFKETFRAKIIG